MPVDLSPVSIVAFTVVKCLGGMLTLFRLGFRLKIQRLWWEDMWAAVALLCTIVSMISVLAVSGTNNDELILIARRIHVYMFTSITWSVRMSLIFAAIRVSYSTLLRCTTLAVAACFVLFWATTLGLHAWQCASADDASTSFPGAGRPDCVVPRLIIIFELTTNCVAEMINAIPPVMLLQRIQFSRPQRKMFLWVYFTTRFLCMFSIAHSIAQLAGTRTVQVVLAGLQLGAFLIVCNLLVVVTYFYRVVERPSDAEPSSWSHPSDDDNLTTPPPTNGATQQLTTVDLELLYTGITTREHELRTRVLATVLSSWRCRFSPR